MECEKQLVLHVCDSESLWVICLWHLKWTLHLRSRCTSTKANQCTVICLFFSHLFFSIKSYLRISNSSFCRTLKPHHTNSFGPSVAFFFVGNIVLIHLVQGFKYSYYYSFMASTTKENS